MKRRNRNRYMREYRQKNLERLREYGRKYAAAYRAILRNEK